MLSAWGVRILVPGDLKPDYVRLVEALGGSSPSLGRGKEAINPLDMGPLGRALEDLRDVRPDLYAQGMAELRGQRLNTLFGLAGLARGESLEDFEETILGVALDICDRDLDREVLIGDLKKVIEDRHPDIAAVAKDRGNIERYLDRTDRLVDALTHLGAEGKFGDIFCRPSTVTLDVDAPAAAFHLAVADTDLELQAALQLVCWTYGSSAVSCAKYLAEAGLRPDVTYVIVMDELWRALRAEEQMVDRVDALTRLNRQRRIGQILITHTMADLKLRTEDATAKAWGFVSRSAMVFLGGLDEKEMGNLEEVFAMTRKEKDLITGWSADPVDEEGGSGKVPPGRGKYLLKTGKRHGEAFKVALTQAEMYVNDTNTRWANATSHVSEEVA